MKLFSLFALLVLTILPDANADPATDAKAERIRSLYQTGVAASQEGDVKSARAAFQGVLELQPGNGHARYQLANLEKNRDTALEAARQKQFVSTVFPKIDFNEAPLDEALEYLELQTAEKTDGKFVPNFIIQDPEGTVTRREITLELSNVPLNVILKYIEEMAGVVIRYDKYATVVSPRGRAAE